MNRKTWLVFVGVQLFGELGPWKGRHIKSFLGPALWVMGFVVMMPGRRLALWLTEKVLSGASLTPGQMTVVFVVIEVAANLLFWLLCARLVRSLRRKRPVPTTAT